jgi:protein CWC15
MSTAHRPTWNSALGSDSQGGSLRGPVSISVSSRDANVTASLNYRKKGQGLPEEQKVRNFREELETKEKRIQEKKRVERPDSAKSIEDEEHSKRRRLEPSKKEPEFNPADKDDTDSSNDEDDDDDNSESDSEEAELLREYEKITKEREEEQKRLEQERKNIDVQAKAQGILRGNPLLNPDRDDFNIKKKWYEDVVFKHQARHEPVKKQRFINDTTRNDFHRKFLGKYVK